MGSSNRPLWIWFNFWNIVFLCHHLPTKLFKSGWHKFSRDIKLTWMSMGNMNRYLIWHCFWRKCVTFIFQKSSQAHYMHGCCTLVKQLLFQGDLAKILTSLFNVGRFQCMTRPRQTQCAAEAQVLGVIVSGATAKALLRQIWVLAVLAIKDSCYNYMVLEQIPRMTHRRKHSLKVRLMMTKRTDFWWGNKWKSNYSKTFWLKIRLSPLRRTQRSKFWNNSWKEARRDLNSWNFSLWMRNPSGWSRWQFPGFKMSRMKNVVKLLLRALQADGFPHKEAFP